ncbi:MAG TPA: hypothetical protein VEJ41_08830 [Candidatus Acidoferrales bacterium]|nr:hypothetical protein [Candidatus Acidoferrales bacterium]
MFTEADWAVVFGVTGFCVGLLSLVYARTQALHARRQADAAYMATALQLQREMSDRIFQHRMALIRDPAIAKMYYENVPGLSEALQGGKTTVESVVTIRNAIDGLQDVYFLRKRGIVEEYHWRHWASAFNVIGRVPMFHLVYENAVARNALDPEFAAYLHPLVEGKPLTDPKSK